MWAELSSALNDRLGFGRKRGHDVSRRHRIARELVDDQPHVHAFGPIAKAIVKKEVLFAGRIDVIGLGESAWAAYPVRNIDPTRVGIAGFGINTLADHDWAGAQNIRVLPGIF